MISDEKPIINTLFIKIIKNTPDFNETELNIIIETIILNRKFTVDIPSNRRLFNTKIINVILDLEKAELNIIIEIIISNRKSSATLLNSRRLLIIKILINMPILKKAE